MTEKAIESVVLGTMNGSATIAGAFSKKLIKVTDMASQASNCTYDEGQTLVIAENTVDFVVYRALADGRFSIVPLLVYYDGDNYTDNVETSSSLIRTILDEAVAGDFQYKVLGYIRSRLHASGLYWTAEFTLDMTQYLQTFVRNYLKDPNVKAGLNIALLFLFQQSQTNATTYKGQQLITYGVQTTPLTGFLAIKANGVSNAPPPVTNVDNRPSGQAGLPTLLGRAVAQRLNSRYQQNYQKFAGISKSRRNWWT